jgi:hypothetical protein
VVRWPLTLSFTLAHEETQAMQQTDRITLDPDSATIVTRGREAWRTLRTDETWEKWVAIGRAVEAGRGAIMRHLHSNQPKGRAWSQTFGQWLRDNEFDQIDKAARSRLQTCLDNLPAIEAWRQTLGLTLRLQLNHPNTVYRRWQAATRLPAPAEPDAAKPLTLSEKKDRELIRLSEELDAANRRLRQRDDLSEGRDWTWHDTPEDIASAMLRLYPDKAKRLGAALQNAAKSTTRKPRAKA